MDAANPKILKAELEKALAECERLREENARLKVRVGQTPNTRFIGVKGRAAVGEIALTANEYKTAQRLGDDYWLYVVFNCGSHPHLNTIQNPARFDWEPLSKIDCYRIEAKAILKADRE